MKTLQDYVLESIIEDTEIIDEGKIWNAIKSWFKNLFKGSNKKYDRWGDGFDGITSSNFRTHIKETFNISSVSIKPIPLSDVMEIVKPLGHTPSKENNDGFWKFVDDNPTTEDREKIKYYAVMYIDNTTKDVCALFKINVNPRGNVLDNYFEIINLQVREEYASNLTLDKLVNVIKNSPEIKKLKKNGMFIFDINTERNSSIEYDNRDIYNKLINDCDFEKGTMNNKKIASIKF